MFDRIRYKTQKEITQYRDLWERKCASFVDRLFFKENNSTTNEKRKVNFFVTVWGQHIDLFYSCIVPSLLQAGNAPVLAQNGYPMELVVYTLSEEDVEHLNSYTDKLNELKKYMNVTFRLIKVKEIQDKNDILINALIQHLEKCCAENAWFLLTPPRYHSWKSFFGQCHAAC